MNEPFAQDAPFVALALTALASTLTGLLLASYAFTLYATGTPGKALSVSRSSSILATAPGLSLEKTPTPDTTALGVPPDGLLIISALSIALVFLTMVVDPPPSRFIAL